MPSCRCFFRPTERLAQQDPAKWVAARFMRAAIGIVARVRQRGLAVDLGPCRMGDQEAMRRLGAPNLQSQRLERRFPNRSPRRCQAGVPDPRGRQSRRNA